MALKGNPPTLLDDVRTVLGDPLVPVLEHEETNVGHGRVETRVARVSTDVAVLAQPCWPSPAGPVLRPSAVSTAPAPASGLVRQRRKASSTCLDTPIRPSACLPSRAVIGPLRTTCTGFSM